MLFTIIRAARSNNIVAELRINSHYKLATATKSRAWFKAVGIRYQKDFSLEHKKNGEDRYVDYMYIISWYSFVWGQ